VSDQALKAGHRPAKALDARGFEQRERRAQTPKSGMRHSDRQTADPISNLGPGNAMKADAPMKPHSGFHVADGKTKSHCSTLRLQD
jgi:hypothetical protein